MLRNRTAWAVSAFLLLWAGLGVAGAQSPRDPVSSQLEPAPVRHGASQPGQEFLVLRHQILAKGRHEDFYRASLAGVWPLYEKIGTRVVGQWQVVSGQDGEPGIDDREYDEGYRLARYRSFDHWLATRAPGELAGNGDDLSAGLEAIRLRNTWRLGSNGVVYLAGSMAAGGPYYYPATGERFRIAADGAEPRVHPLRSERSKSGREIVTLRYFRIEKGSFDEFNRLSREGVWPFFEKMGARIVGQWQVVYPRAEEFGGRATGDLAVESSEYDEAYMMVRYASHEHWQATRGSVMHRLGGDGADYEAARDALEQRRALTVESSVEFLQGHFYSSPPIYLPSLDERYELEDDRP